jgi:EAL domain-containing protein (putative c-di-GMP-specific phosphodiesterase class I)/GGDEF domain-containing protein
MAQASPPEALCIVASIANLRRIEHAYGSPTASAVRQILRERARKVCEAEGGVATLSGDHILFVFDAPLPPLESSAASDLHATLLMEDVLSSLADRPVEVAGITLFLSVSVNVAPFTDEPFDIDSFGENEVLAAPGGRAWRERFIADMTTARGLLNALFKEQLGLEWEPVRDVQGDGPVHYYEALLCDMNGAQPRRVGCDVPVLERLGLVRRLDQWVVESTIESLRFNGDVSLGCNISAQSTRIDIWWALIIETLSAEPDIASRLIIEITESALLPDMEIVREFVRSLQALGCRIALDDVGAGHSSLKALLDLGVDFVKIDAVYVRQARHDAVGAMRLLQLVTLARSCAPHVVLEGIESEEDAALSLSSGATGLQGYLYPKTQIHDRTSPTAKRRKLE